MNKYKRALTALARVAFIHADETEQGDKIVRQALYRHLCAVGIAKYENEKPKWCELIASGKKTVEVRKTAPKDTPFKVYMYCTKDGYMYRCRIDENRLAIPEVWNGKVVGEFVCDKVYKIVPDGEYYSNGYDIDDDMLSETCLGRGYLTGYGLGYTLYGWHITDLKIYDKPKELGEFRSIKCTNKNGSCSDCKIKPDCIKYLTRPPQSWQYVEPLDK